MKAAVFELLGDGRNKKQTPLRGLRRQRAAALSPLAIGASHDKKPRNVLVTTPKRRNSPRIIPAPYQFFNALNNAQTLSHSYLAHSGSRKYANIRICRTMAASLDAHCRIEKAGIDESKQLLTEIKRESRPGAREMSDMAMSEAKTTVDLGAKMCISTIYTRYKPSPSVLSDAWRETNE